MAKINPKLILELIESGMSRRQICSSRHVSSHTVSEVKQIAEKNNITTKDIKNMSEDDVYRMFFPDRNQLEDMYEQPDKVKLTHKTSKSRRTLIWRTPKTRQNCPFSKEYRQQWQKIVQEKVQVGVQFVVQPRVLALIFIPPAQKKGPFFPHSIRLNPCNTTI